jgi:hypothetical protein
VKLEETEGGSLLRAGDIVEVRPASEILATLDRDGTLKGMPFMPEMIAHIGRRFTVTRRVDKICNMVDTTGSRRMRGTVYLADLRCDGSAHGGCQAGCRIYWREEWLRRADHNSMAPGTTGDTGAAELERVAVAGTHAVREIDGKTSDGWRCQATDALKASAPLKRSDVRQYWRELTNGNYNPLRFAGLLIRAFVMDCAYYLGLLKTLPLRGTGQVATKGPKLNLKPGELVQVRTPREIAATALVNYPLHAFFYPESLSAVGKHLAIEGKPAVLAALVKGGRMLKIPRDCVILDGVACSGERSVCGRWFCPRGIYPFWRESWLRRVEEPKRP